MAFLKKNLKKKFVDYKEKKKFLFIINAARGHLNQQMIILYAKSNPTEQI
jgi:hypothetical protein